MTPDRWLTGTLTAATVIPYGLLDGFGPGDHSILPWVGALVGWSAWVLIARSGISRGWWRLAHEDRAAVAFEVDATDDAL
jgi:hypothetical protein